LGCSVRRLTYQLGKERIRKLMLRECSLWRMLLVKNAPCEECSLWRMLLVKNAPCEECSLWRIRKWLIKADL
jgi:hypothetical protein